MRGARVNFAYLLRRLENGGFTSAEALLHYRSLPLRRPPDGRLAQGESTSLTRKGSQVQILHRPPRKKRPATCGNSGSGSSVFWMTWTRYGPFRNILTTYRVRTSTPQKASRTDSACMPPMGGWVLEFAHNPIVVGAKARYGRRSNRPLSCGDAYDGSSQLGAWGARMCRPSAENATRLDGCCEGQRPADGCPNASSMGSNGDSSAPKNKIGSIGQRRYSDLARLNGGFT